MLNLFSKAKPVPEVYIISDNKEELEIQLKEVSKRIQDLPEDCLEYKALMHRKRCIVDKFYSLKLPSPAQPAPFVPGLRNYHELLERTLKLDMEAAWLDAKLEQSGATIKRNELGEVTAIDDWKVSDCNEIYSILHELELKVAQLAKEKAAEAKRLKKLAKEKARNPEDFPGPIAEPGMKAVPMGDGTFNHASDVEHGSEFARKGDYEKVVEWAALMGVDAHTVGIHWAVVQGKVKADELTKKTTLMMLQERVRWIVNQRKKEGETDVALDLFNRNKAEEAMKELIEDPVPMKPSVDEVIAKAHEQAADEIHKAAVERLARLGIPTEFKTREEVDKAMKFRAAAIAELALITEQFESAKQRLEKDITDFDLVNLERLEVWFTANKPENGKKSMDLLYGKLGTQDQPRSIALVDTKDGEALFQGWLHQMYNIPAKKSEFDIGTKVQYTRNLDKVKEALNKEWPANEAPPAVPGLKFTEAQKDKFYIRPSLNTVHEDIKKQLKEKGLR